VCAQVTLTKTGLSAVRTFSPLGVKTEYHTYSFLVLKEI
jgi:hypothetical protein